MRIRGQAPQRLAGFVIDRPVAALGRQILDWKYHHTFDTRKFRFFDDGRSPLPWLRVKTARRASEGNEAKGGDGRIKSKTNNVYRQIRYYRVLQ